MKTGPAADNGNNLGVVCHFRSEKNNRNKNQNGHKSHDEIDDPKRIIMRQKIGNGISASFYPWRFFLYIDDQNHYG